MNNRAVVGGDSGFGGLTVVKEIMDILPNEKIVYFGDTARVPYGNKSKDNIIKYSIENADFLLLQLEIPIKTVKYAAALAKKSNTIVILDPAPAVKLSDDAGKHTGDIEEVKLCKGILRIYEN